MQNEFLNKETNHLEKDIHVKYSKVKILRSFMQRDLKNDKYKSLLVLFGSALRLKILE